MHLYRVALQMAVASALALVFAACGGGDDVTNIVDSGTASDSAIQPDAAPVADCSRCLREATCDDSGSQEICTCPDGFAGDGTIAGTGCMDIDECADMVDGCVPPASGGSCTNVSGTFACACQDQYDGDGTVAGTGCTPEPCVNNTCAPDAICTNVDAINFSCACPPGFEGDGSAAGTGCTDLDECALGTINCGDALCQNRPGGVSCLQLVASTPYTNDVVVLNPDAYLAGQFEDPETLLPCDGPAVVAQFRLAEDGAIDSFVTGSTALARHPGNGRLFIIYKVEGEAGRVLGTLDAATGLITRIGNTGDNVSSLAFDADENLFAATGDGASTRESLWLVDQVDASLTLITSLEDGSDGAVLGFHEADGFLYHLSGRANDSAANLVDVNVDTTDPTNVIISATKAPVVQNGFAYEEAFGMVFGWPNPANFGVVGLDGVVIDMAFNSTQPALPSLTSSQRDALATTTACNPGPSTSQPMSFMRGIALVDVAITPRANGVPCTDHFQCAGVCDLVGSSNCEPDNRCGNGLLEGVELCDDGNTLNGDGCEGDCGVVKRANGSACAIDYECINVCDSLGSGTCEPSNVCGNGSVEGAETCDDGNVTDADGCSAACLLEP